MRVGLALVLAVYLTYSSFGFAHPVLWGHFGHHTGEYLQRAKTSLRFHMVTPATSAGYEYPAKQFFYFHHPIGYHHIYTLVIALVGDHAWVGAAVPALMGLLTLWALYALVRRRWSREAGLVCVAVYVGLPILCSFSILTDAMLPTMACSLWLVHAFLNYLDSPSRKWLLHGCAAIVLGGLLMWELYLQSFLHGLFIVAVLGIETARHRRTLSVRAGLTWLFTTGAVAASTMTFHFSFLYLRGMWDDFFASYHQRKDASNWHYILDRHTQWLEILYGWPVILPGIVWLGVFLGRALAGHARRRDQAVFLYFALNLIYIYLFSEASAVHLYRVFFFSTFFALAITDLVVDLYQGMHWIAARAPRLPRLLPIALSATALCLYFAIETPHAIHNLIESREMMGTHGFGPGYNADYPKQLFAMEVMRRTGPEDFVFVHDNLVRRIEFYYYVDRSNMNISTVLQVPAQLKAHPRSVILMDGYPPPGERKAVYDLLKHHTGYLFDRYLMIDLRSNEPGFHEYTFEPEKPSWVWRWFVSHKYPPMHLKEVTTMYAPCVYADVQIAPRKPVAEPAVPHLGKSDLVLCYHNYEVVRGRRAEAQDLLRRLAPGLDQRDVRLGSVGRFLGLRNLSRTGAELWMLVDKPPPPGLVWRYRLVPEAGPAPSLPAAGTLGTRTPAGPLGKPQGKPGQPASALGAKPPASAFPVAAPPVIAPVIAGEARPNPSGDREPFELRAGYLYAESLKWGLAPAGRYRLRLELGLPTPPAPPPPRRPPLPPTAKPAQKADPQHPAPVPPVLAPTPAIKPPPPPPPLASADLGVIEIR